MLDQKLTGAVVTNLGFLVFCDVPKGGFAKSKTIDWGEKKQRVDFPSWQELSMVKSYCQKNL